MPEQMRTVSSPKNSGSTGARPMITSATMFTSTRPYRFRDSCSMSFLSPVTLPVRAVKSGAAKPL